MRPAHTPKRFLTKHLDAVLLVVFVALVGGIGSHYLFTSHADSLLTLYKMAYPGGTQYEIYNTTSAASEQTEISHGWKLLGSYKFVNEAGSAPIPVYQGHQTGTRNNIYSTNKASIPAGWTISTAFYESSSSRVPYGYCRSTASGYKLDLPCSTNPAPAPPPAPAPTPTPTPTPSPSPTPSPTPVKTAPKPTAPVASPTTPSANADGTVTTGTTTAAIKLPAGNATTLHLVYGKTAVSLNQASPDQATNNTDITVTVTGLSAKTVYYYQIVRSLNGQIATSPVADFTTRGYDVSLVLLSKDKPVSGVIGQLDNTKVTSGKDGRLTFKNVADGSYSVRFTYKGHTYSQAISTDSAAVNDELAPTAVEQSVDLDDLEPTAARSISPSANGSAMPVTIMIVIGLALVGGGVWFALFRRRGSGGLEPYAPTIPINPSVGGDILDKHSYRLSKQKLPEPEPLPEHAGKSLREMVVESMHAEAARRKAQQPPDDGVPK